MVPSFVKPPMASITPSPCPQRPWHLPLEKRVSDKREPGPEGLGHSPGQQFQHRVANTRLPCPCHLPPSWQLAAFLGPLLLESVNIAG